MKTIVILSLLFWFSHAVAAPPGGNKPCPGNSNKLTITIVQQDGQYKILNKENLEGCEFKHDKKNGLIIWDFHKIPTCEQSGICHVQLDQASAETQKKFECPTKNNGSFCKLNVSYLKDHCDNVDPGDPAMCALSYKVYIDTMEIDPTILISPRPEL